MGFQWEESTTNSWIAPFLLYIHLLRKIGGGQLKRTKPYLCYVGQSLEEEDAWKTYQQILVCHECIIGFSLTNFSSRIKTIIMGIHYHEAVVNNISGSQATLSIRQHIVLYC